MSLMELTAHDLAAAVRRGEATPQDCVKEALARAEERNPAINAICLINPEARAEAQQIEVRLAKGEDLPLAGVPVLIKDNIWVKGLQITQGSQLFADHIAPKDATAVQRLRQAGAVILGITISSEFACKGATTSPLYGLTRNPLDLSKTTGGSSGGSVAAVAAGIVPLALGTDAGGSSRRPPAHTGLCGFKPTQDLIPYGPSFDEPVWGISVICPIARNMGDIVLAMSVLAGIEPQAPTRNGIAYSPDFGTGQRLDPDVSANFEQVLAALKGAGLPLQAAEMTWPNGLQGQDIQPLQYAGLAHFYGDQWRADPSVFDPALARQIETGLALTGLEVAAAHQASHHMRQTLRAALETYGFLITPTTPCAAWDVELDAPAEIGGMPAAPRDHAAFTPQINHAGVPAVSLPCGRDKKGLPLGLQVIAPAGADADLLHMAERLEPMLREIS